MHRRLDNDARNTAFDPNAVRCMTYLSVDVRKTPFGVASDALLRFDGVRTAASNFDSVKCTGELTMMSKNVALNVDAIKCIDEITSTLEKLYPKKVLCDRIHGQFDDNVKNAASNIDASNALTNFHLDDVGWRC